MRTKIVHFSLLAAFIVVILGLFNIQVISNDQYTKLSNKNSIRLLPQIGSRGRILDRRGEVIVDNQIAYDLMILPREIRENDKLLYSISNIVGISFQELEENSRKGFVSFNMPVAIARNIDIKKAIALEELKSDLPGMLIQPHPGRDYPNKRLGAHLVGYLSEIDHWRLTKLEDYGYKTKDIVGFGGIEEKYDYYLRQDDGGLSVEVDRKGRFRRILGFKQPQKGRDIQLTIDLRIQKIVENVLDGSKGCIVIMDPHTGEVLALSSRPNFNPEVFVEKKPFNFSKIFNNPDAPLFNRAISGSYPPGSIFKIIMATAALQTGKLNTSNTYVCSGSLDIGGDEFGCWSTHNQQNLIDAIAHSCDVFFYRTGILMGPQVIYDYSMKFGLNKLTGIDLPYETTGFVPSPLWKRLRRFKNWYTGDTANLSIGQGDLLVTPLQMARMVAAFANKGVLVDPYVVKAVDNKDISSSQQHYTDLGLKESTLSIINRGLRRVVTDDDGTASVLAKSPVSVAGKTGTAQVPRGKSHAWFVGFFPFEEPKYAICVFLENGSHGVASAVLTQLIIDKMLEEGVI